MTDYQANYEILKQVCAEKSVIRHVSKHRKPDGTIDREGNLKIWNDAVARFRVTPLWDDGAPNYDDRDPMQIPPSLIFVPAQGPKKSGAPSSWLAVAALRRAPAARASTWRNISPTRASTPPSSPTG